MSRDRQNVFLNACDVTIASLVRGMRGAAVPSRVYNYLAAGKPLIGVCETNTELSRIVEEEDVGVSVEPGDAIGLAAAIRHLMGSRALRERMSRNARAAAVKKYSADVILPLYRNALLGDK